MIDGAKPRLNDATPDEWSNAVRQGQKYSGDEVNEPQHYNYGKYETIDVIVDTLGEYEAISYCHGNVLKYTMRMWHKGKPITDCKKARWYMNKMIELLEKTEGINW